MHQPCLARGLAASTPSGSLLEAGKRGWGRAGRCPTTLSSPACCEFLLWQSCVHAQLVSLFPCVVCHVAPDMQAQLQVCNVEPAFDTEVQHTKSCREHTDNARSRSIGLNGVAVFYLHRASVAYDDQVLRFRSSLPAVVSSLNSRTNCSVGGL